MSHAATKWAFDQPEAYRDMKPSEWAVLMVLADCHNPVNGCFPSQDYICSRTNLGERAVRDQLARLRGRNLVNWAGAWEKGHRAENRYMLSFEVDFIPAESAGSQTGEIEQAIPAESDSSYRQNSPPSIDEPVREPVIEPSVEREARAGEAEKPLEPTPADRKRFDDAVKAHWPNLALDDSERGFTAWWALEAGQRETSLDRIADFVALHRSKKRDHLPALSTYFRQLRFEALPPKPEDGGGLSVALPARSEGWCAMFFRLAIAGSPQSTFAARRMLADAEFDRPAWCRSDDLPSAEGWPKIERGSDQFKAWRKHLGEQGIWLKPECFGAWLWVPSEWPQEDVKTARAG